MRIRIFRATTLALAMAQVRDELGLDALILTTEEHGGLVEVTAALEPEDEEAAPLDLSPPPSFAQHDTIDMALRWHGVPSALAASLGRHPLERTCQQLFRFDTLPIEAGDPPLLLVGPPGAGKTLTVAKLATRLVLQGQKPLVITCDERRAGGVEQLAAFTRLLGLTLIAAGRPEMLERALARRELSAPVLIDAPGLDLNEPAEEDLLRCLAEASRSEIALVLPAGLDSGHAEETAHAHAAFGAGRLIATRLDRAGRLGGTLAAAHGAGLALTEAGVGAQVAGGLVPLTSAFLADRLATMPAARGKTATARARPVAVQDSPRTQPQTAAPEPRRARRSALEMHIAAQAQADRLPLWKAQ